VFWGLVCVAIAIEAWRAELTSRAPTTAGLPAYA
jgi:hypothetical protein